jgi:hypothetical protein
MPHLVPPLVTRNIHIQNNQSKFAKCSLRMICIGPYDQVSQTPKESQAITPFSFLYKTPISLLSHFWDF